MARKPALYHRKNAGVSLSRPVIAALRVLNPNKGPSDPVETIVGRWLKDNIHLLEATAPDLVVHIRALDLPGAKGAAPIKGETEAVSQVYLPGGVGVCPVCSSWDYDSDDFIPNVCPVCDGERSIASRARVHMDVSLQRGAIASKAYKEQRAREEAESRARIERDKQETLARREELNRRHMTEAGDTLLDAPHTPGQAVPHMFVYFDRNNQIIFKTTLHCDPARAQAVAKAIRPADVPGKAVDRVYVERIQDMPAIATKSILNPG